MARTLKTSENGPGHNSGMIDRDALKRDVERVASLMQEVAGINEDIKEICKAADEAGTCTRRELRRLARESLMDNDVLTAQLERMDTLRHALGQLQDTPLGNAAVKNAEKRSRKPQTDIEDAIADESAGYHSSEWPEPPEAA